MMSFWFEAIVGPVPWISIWLNIIGAKSVPGFIYAIVVAQIVLFFSFGAQPVAAVPRRRQMDGLHQRREDLSRAHSGGKSLLAGQIFGGSLASILGTVAGRSSVGRVLALVGWNPLQPRVLVASTPEP
jgi:hypothetical protein